MDTTIGLHGHVKAVVTRADGTQKVYTSGPNTIHADLKNKIASGYIAEGTYWGCLINAFASDDVVQLASSHNGQSGISVYITGPPTNGSTLTYYMMDTDFVSSSGSPTTSFKIQGVIRNDTGTSRTFNGAIMGYSWDSASSDFDVRFADAAGWTNVQIDDGEMLTVEWTISIS